MQLIERPLNAKVKQQLSQQLPEWLADILARRLDDPQEASQLIQAGLSHLPSPFTLPDMDKAVQLLIDSIQQQQDILCVVDYDTDGISSGAILQEGLSALGAKVSVMVTNRHEDGYGFSAGACQRILALAKLPDMIITADLGSSDGQHIAQLQQQANAQGARIQVIVTDHHHISDVTPPSSAQAFINPHRQDCQHDYAHPICGAMVAWNLIAALRNRLTQSEYIALQQAAQQLNTRHLLDLAAIATIADMVDLANPINRAIVRVGLQRMNERQRPAWQLLREALDSNAPINEETIGFQISPRINALSRMGDDGHTALTWLTTQHMSSCQQAWAIMSENNNERKDEQALCESYALEVAKQQVADGRFILVVFVPHASHGVVGLAAGRLAQRFGRPAIVFADYEGERLTGSARSIPGYDVRSLLERVHQQTELLNKYGGHAAAAGLTIKPQHLATLSEALEAQIRVDLNQQIPQPTLLHDGKLPKELMNIAGVHDLQAISPFGQGLPVPSFCVDAELVAFQHMGKAQQHRRLTLRCQQGELNSVWFNASEQIQLTPNQHYRCVLNISINHFRGQQNLQAMIHTLLPISKS